MKDCFIFFFFCTLRVPYSRAVSPLLIDCIIPRVRYLSMPVSYQYRGDPKSMNKARRDAAGPHLFLVWWVVWNGRYLNLFY